jgi:hypothetical protein
MTTTGLRLTLSAADRLPLDEPLVAIVRLVNQGTGPVTVSSRLNLAEDLSVTVTGPVYLSSSSPPPRPGVGTGCLAMAGRQRPSAGTPGPR